jgi:hypothetical protein
MSAACGNPPDALSRCRGGISPRKRCFSAIACATCGPIDSANRVSSETFHHTCAGSITLFCKTPPMLMRADARATGRSPASAEARDVRAESFSTGTRPSASPATSAVRGQTGKQLLFLSFSGCDPERRLSKFLMLAKDRLSEILAE